MDLESSIARRMATIVLSNTFQLLDFVEITAELDWFVIFATENIQSFLFFVAKKTTINGFSRSSLISFAEATKQYNYTRPTLTLENVIYIENGRHPLQELCVQQPFIPNSTAISYGSFCLFDGSRIFFLF
jgi:hypothetical protein